MLLANGFGGGLLLQLCLLDSPLPRLSFCDKLGQAPLLLLLLFCRSRCSQQCCSSLGIFLPQARRLGRRFRCSTVAGLLLTESCHRGLALPRLGLPCRLCRDFLLLSRYRYRLELGDCRSIAPREGTQVDMVWLWGGRRGAVCRDIWARAQCRIGQIELGVATVDAPRRLFEMLLRFKFANGVEQELVFLWWVVPVLNRRANDNHEAVDMAIGKSLLIILLVVWNFLLDHVADAPLAQHCRRDVDEM
mmetsp:Transcript_5495/g.16587  ORF Transcript_5495/g.16587 Transcript_5495/m.16587 type:complete len:247 (-) Transcript_5495:918-1658(-)